MHRTHPHKVSSRAQQFFFALFVVCALLLWQIFTHVLSAPPHTLRIWFFDIGQGDALFVETPNGKQLLIDGGRDKTVLQKLSSVMWPWDRSLDAVIATHPDSDHITGLASVLERYDVSTIFTTGVTGQTPLIQAFERAVKNENALQKQVRRNQKFEYDGVVFEVHWPTDEAVVHEKERNNTSIVLEIVYGGQHVLLTGDAEEPVEQAIAEAVGDVDVVKLGHHGSASSSSVPFLKTIRPEVAIVSAGLNNTYGHPHPIVLERLRDFGVSVLRTDLDGDILFSSDGNRYTIRPVFLPF